MNSHRVEACRRSIRNSPAPGCHARRVAVGGRTGAAAVLTVVVGSLTGWVTPDVEVVGALGVTVDEEQRPVVVVEAYEGAATRWTCPSTTRV